MNTFGWDTVYVININKINNSLLSNKDKLILNFDTTGTTELPVVAKGTFSRWEIVQGGSGAILYLKLHIGNGKVLFTNTRQECDMSGIALVVAVQLTLLPKQDKQELKFNIQSVGEIGIVPQPGVITPVTLQGAEGKLDNTQCALLMIALSQFILANAAQLTYVFATINLVPPSVNSWLTPVQSAYMYMSRENAPGALAVLSVSTEKNISDLPLQVDAQLLSPAYDASFGISRELFLKNVIQPALPDVFKTASASFVYNPSRENIQNTKTIAMPAVKSGAIFYYPELSLFHTGTTGSGLTSKYEGYCDLKAGISMRFWIDPTNEAIYNPEYKMLYFLSDPSPVTRNEVHIPWYWWFSGLLIRGIMELIVRAVGNSIAQSLTTDVSKYLTLTKNPPTSVQWTGTEQLNIQAASLNVGFYMQGNLA